MDKLITEMNRAIEGYGIGSQEALEASRKLDIAVAREQSILYKEYKIRNK